MGLESSQESVSLPASVYLIEEEEPDIRKLCCIRDSYGDLIGGEICHIFTSESVYIVKRCVLMCERRVKKSRKFHMIT